MQSFAITRDDKRKLERGTNRTITVDSHGATIVVGELASFYLMRGVATEYERVFKIHSVDYSEGKHLVRLDLVLPDWQPNLTPPEYELSPIELLRQFRESISLFKGHGTPGFTDRALAYVLIDEVDKLLAKEYPDYVPK